jgi:hypothetical protein
MVLSCFLAVALPSGQKRFIGNLSWDRNGWRFFRIAAYDPCKTPAGKPSGAIVAYQFGPLTYLTLQLPSGTLPPATSESPAATPPIPPNGLQDNSDSAAEKDNRPASEVAMKEFLDPLQLERNRVSSTRSEE